MIDLLKKAPNWALFLLTGLAFYFSELALSLQLIASAAYLTGTSYAALVVSVSLMTVGLSALVAKFLIYVSYRITGAIFTRKSGMLYPFPIAYGDYGKTVLAFAIPCFLVCGITGIPVLFFPTLSLIESAVRNVVLWATFALAAFYFVRRNAHDYDRRTLAFSLSVIPIVLIALSLILTIVEVAR